MSCTNEIKRSNQNTRATEKVVCTSDAKGGTLLKEVAKNAASQSWKYFLACFTIMHPLASEVACFTISELVVVPQGRGSVEAKKAAPV